ncbi:hypothetical protein [Gordonia terrae]|uniref:hypothetical protein n=1 Tax=Gordonia terrae TaxID=2055 RepID=UPI003F6D4755
MLLTARTIIQDVAYSGGDESISMALERLALALGEGGAVPVAELVRALERAAERLRNRTTSVEPPTDLVTQAEAARMIGVSRQAVNQWVRKGTLRTYESVASGRSAPEVSLAEVAIAANRRTREVPFSSSLRRELTDFLSIIDQGSTRGLATALSDAVDDDSASERTSEKVRILGEFVTASMGVGDQQHEFTEAGLGLLAQLDPVLPVDPDRGFGRLANSLGLLITSAQGKTGFDTPSTALLGLLGAATVGAQYEGPDAMEGSIIADAARDVWSDDWPLRLYDAAYHVGELRPAPLARYTASLVYLDYHRFLRQAQSGGLTIAYSRGPGPLIPHRYFGGPVLFDRLTGRPPGEFCWEFSAAAARKGRPVGLDSAVSPFRIMNYHYGLLDSSVHGIRRYCFSAENAGRELRDHLGRLSTAERETYTHLAIETLATALSEPRLELVAVDRESDFDWWKDHLIRSSPGEVLLGLRDHRARQVAHALLVQTSTLPQVVEAAQSDSSLRDRMRIYVKNLEFDVIDARYQDDLRRGVTRVIKRGGESLDRDDAYNLAERELRNLT